MDSGGPLTAGSMADGAMPNKMGGSDSQLGKAGAAGSLDATSLAISKIMAEPDPGNLHAIAFYQEVPNESAFVPPVKQPPRL